MEVQMQLPVNLFFTQFLKIFHQHVSAYYRHMSVLNWVPWIAGERIPLSKTPTPMSWIQKKKKKMARMEEGETASASSSNTRLRSRTRPDPFLVVCKCFSLITAITAILCIFVNVLSAIRSFENGSDVLLLLSLSFSFSFSCIFIFILCKWDFWAVFDLWLM